MVFTNLVTLTVAPDETRKRFLHDSKELRRCRFCGRTAPEVSFRSAAHVLPSCLGNRVLHTLEECDGCNDHGSTLEDDLAKFLVVDRLTSMIRPQRTPIVSHRHRPDGSRVEAKPGQNQLSFVLSPADASLRMVPRRHGVDIELTTQTFRPANVARALGRMMLHVVDEAELPSLSHLVAWVGKGGARLWHQPTFYFERLEDPQLMQLRVGTGLTADRQTFYRVDFVFWTSCLTAVLPGRPDGVRPFEADDGMFAIVATWDAKAQIDCPGLTHKTFVPARWVDITDAEVAAAAFERWERAGRPEGTAEKDWLEAEAQLCSDRFHALCEIEALEDPAND